MVTAISPIAREWAQSADYEVIMLEQNIKVQKEDFLSPELKQLKQKIMEDLLSSIYGPLGIMAANDHTSAPALTDIIMSCLIMFTRDILITVIISSTAKQAPDAFLDSVLAVIKKEILENLKNE